MSKALNNVIWKPQYKQQLLISCPAFETFFGGARGGGKSDAALGAFLLNVNKYGKHHKGVIFRRTLPELEDIFKRAQEIYLPLGAKQIGTINCRPAFVFPSGSELRFRYLESDQDATRYQGHQYTFICFDELGNYPTDFAFTFMSACARSAAGVPCRMIATGNPGGVGHSWIKARFIDNIEPYKVQTVELGDGLTTTRCFIPSTLDDNPILLAADPEYPARLRMQSSELYRAFRFGDWDIIAGNVFDEFRREKHVIKPFALLQGEYVKFCSIDWGYSKPYSIGFWAVSRTGRMIRYRELYGCEKDKPNTGTKESVADVARKAWEIAALDGVDTMIADPAVWGKVDNADLSVAEKFAAAGWKMIKGNNDRLAGLQAIHDYLKTTDSDGRPMMLIFSTCKDFIRTIPFLLPDKNRPEDIDSKLEDHIYDETRYAVMSDFVSNPARALEVAYRRGVRKAQRKDETYNPFDNM